ncbi:hypothetical protein, partial [Mycoplasma sp. 5370]
TKIANLFSSIDSVLSLHKRKYNFLKNIKNTLLDKMFPSQNSNIPSIRFKEFTHAWEQEVLGNLLASYTEKNSKNVFKKEDVLSVSGEFGVVNQIRFLGRSFAGESLINYKVLDIDDIVYTKSPLNKNPYGIIKTNSFKKGIVSVLYSVFKAKKEKLIPVYMEKYFLLDSRLNNFLFPVIQKGAKNTLIAKDEELLNKKIIISNLQEQEKIIKLFLSLDSLLSLHKRKLTALENIKAKLLERMFI